MNNAELIDALQTDIREVEDNSVNTLSLMWRAADALEAAERRIVNLLTALHLANEKLAYVDCQPYTEIDGEEMIDDWVKTLVYEELHTQMPKEGGRDAANVNGDQSDEDKAVIDCSYCPSVDGCLEAFSESTLCPNCGARMRKGDTE